MADDAKGENSTLTQGQLPIGLIRVAVYEDASGRRFVDVEGDHEPEFAASQEAAGIDHTKIAGRRIRLVDLLDAGLLEAGDALTWKRPKLGDSYTAHVNEQAAIQLPDGRSFTSPSRAAMEAADIVSYDGWYAWRLDRNGKLVNDLRKELVDERNSN